VAINKRRCSRCGVMFQPAKNHYRLCNRCNKDTYPIGFTSSKRRAGGADLMHGGQSRQRDGTLRRPLAMRGDSCREAILDGYRNFATDYFGHTAGLSTIFKNAGCDDASLRALSDSQKLNNLLIDFCPAFRKWVYQYAGDKAMELVVEYYGLYGDDRLSMDELAYNLDLKSAEAYKKWILKKLREKDAEVALEEIAAEVAFKLIQHERD